MFRVKALTCRHLTERSAAWRFRLATFQVRTRTRARPCTRVGFAPLISPTHHTTPTLLPPARTHERAHPNATRSEFPSELQRGAVGARKRTAARSATCRPRAAPTSDPGFRARATATAGAGVRAAASLRATSTACAGVRAGSGTGPCNSQLRATANGLSPGD